MPKISKEDLTFHKLGIEDRRPDIADTTPPFKIIPRITLNLDQLPELEGKDIDGECHLYVIGKIKSINAAADFEPTDSPSYSLELEQAAYIGSKDKDGEFRYVEGYKES